MSRKYDPQRVFNHKRTNVQQKGQSYQVKLIDEAPPRVDDQILQKAYNLCKAYNVIPKPILVNLPVEDVLTFQYDQFLAAGSTFIAVCPSNTLYKNFSFYDQEFEDPGSNQNISLGFSLKDAWDNNGVITHIMVRMYTNDGLRIHFGDNNEYGSFQFINNYTSGWLCITFVYIGAYCTIGGLKWSSDFSYMENAAFESYMDLGVQPAMNVYMPSGDNWFVGNIYIQGYNTGTISRIIVKGAKLGSDE